MSHSSLAHYYQLLFQLKSVGHFSIGELETLVPFERDIYVELLQNHLKQQADSGGPADVPIDAPGFG